MNVLVAV
jgi:COMPASS component SWD3